MCIRDSPPSLVRNTPAVDTATVTASGSAGSVSTVCRPSPPPPGIQALRVGCSHSGRTSSKDTPRSVERNSAAGSVPAYTTSGASGPAGCSCHTRSREAPVSRGKRTAGSAGSCQLAPRSSEVNTEGPQWELSPPTSSRGAGPRRSIAAAYTAWALKCGPSNDHGPPFRLRAMKSPLRVPARSSTSGMVDTSGHRRPGWLCGCVMRLPASLHPATDNGPAATPGH